MPLTLDLLFFGLPNGSNLVTRVSTNAAGMGFNGHTTDASRSPDGRYLMFESDAKELANDSLSHRDIFLKSLTGPDAGKIVRISTDANGIEANGTSWNGQISADGRYVVFESVASNLVPNDKLGFSDIFVKHIEGPDAGKIVRISTDANGIEANSASGNGQISADGRYVVFESVASNLVPNDNNGARDIFLKYIEGPEAGKIVRVSAGSNGAQGNGGSEAPQLSGDGRYLVFTSTSTNLSDRDKDTNRDVYLKDLVAGEVTLVSITPNGVKNDAVCSNPYISQDGRYLVFDSNSYKLAANDRNAVADVFRKDLVTGEIMRVSTTATGEEARGGGSHATGISADGRYVFFTSLATNLVPNDSNGSQDVFRKDMLTGEVLCLSVSDPATQANQVSNQASFGTWFSLDGQSALFTTAAPNLVTGDSNAFNDAFLVDLAGLTEQQAMLDGRFVELRFGVGTASSATVSWGDGSAVDTATPLLGAVTFRHAFASQGSKAITVTVREGETSWALPYIVTATPGGANPVRNTVLADTLTGGAGADRLDGDAYANVLIGKDGDDAYTVNHAGDRVVETAGGGTDTVTASVSYTLGGGVYVEYLAASGTDAISLTGNELSNQITGNGAANTLVGEAGNDVLDGAGGADILAGGLGDDTYLINAPGALISELAEAGTDTVLAGANHTLAANVEHLVAAGTGAIALTGNALANWITGNTASNKLTGGAGNDTLNGGVGNDKLYGGLGKDVLTGGVGKDVFVFDTKPNAKTNLDRIADFNVRDDSLFLDNAVFKKLGKGYPTKPYKLNKAFFTVGDKAKDANDYLVYNAKTGVLSYDIDGSGSKAAVEIAVLKKGLKLTYADFFVI